MKKYIEEFKSLATKVLEEAKLDQKKMRKEKRIQEGDDEKCEDMR